MHRTFWLLLGLQLCAGCAKHEKEQPGSILYGHPEVDSKTPCASIGGYWFRCKSGEFLCDEPTYDVGKTCNDSHDCEAT